MRLSTTEIFQTGINSILSQQSQVNTTQLQLSSGKRVLTPSDDPAASAQILRLNSELTRIDQYQENADLAANQLALEEGVIDSAENVLQRVRELVLQSNNSIQSDETRAAIAVEIDERLSELLDIANSQNFNGEYTFSGFQTATEPFAVSAGTVTYAGDDGQRFVQVGASSEIAIGDSGEDVFMRIPSGNGSFEFSAASTNAGEAKIGATSADVNFVSDSYSIEFTQATPADPATYSIFDSTPTLISTGTYEDGDTLTFAGASVGFSGIPSDGDSFTITPSSSQDVFTSIRNIVTSLNSATEASASQAQLATELALAIENIDRAMTHLSEVRTSIGSRLNRIDSQSELNTGFTLQLQETLSMTEDVDLTEAISRLNLQLTSLEAAQQTYVSVQNLSLFNYL